MAYVLCNERHMSVYTGVMVCPLVFITRCFRVRAGVMVWMLLSEVGTLALMNDSK